MKKRIISLILVILMIMTILPASVLAASDTKLVAACSGSENLYDSMDINMLSQMETTFYLVSGDSREVVSPDSLSFPREIVTIERTDKESGMCVIFAAHTGSGSITCTKGGVTYELAVNVGLPHLGLYSSSVFTEENLIEDVSLTEEGCVFYIALNPELAQNGYRLLSVHDTFNSEIECPNIKSIASVSVSQDGSYAAVAITDPAAAGNYHFEADVEKIGGEETQSLGRDIWIENRMPTLMFRYMEWDSEKGIYIVNSEAPLQKQLTLSIGEQPPFIFYYGTEESCVSVSFDLLTFPGDVLSAWEKDGAVVVQPLVFDGKGTITYKNGSISADLGVDVIQPQFGIYSSSTASAETYLNDEIAVGSADDVFYIIASEDTETFTVSAIEHVGDGSASDAADSFTITYSNDGSFAKVAPKAGSLPSGGRYAISIEFGNNQYTNIIEFKLSRTDLPALSTPTKLEWHREYRQTYDEDTGESSEDVVTRMGAMSFLVGETTQNHYDVEIYSAAVSDTDPVLTGSWQFDDMNRYTHFTLTDFIYGDLPSGTYQFRVRALGDGTVYRDSEWSAFSEPWTYTQPKQQLKAPDSSTFEWVKRDGHYWSAWESTDEEAADYYEIKWLVSDKEQGFKSEQNGFFDIRADENVDGIFSATPGDDLLLENGNVTVYFHVRTIPGDITKYRISEYSALSSAFDVAKVAVSVNDKLDTILSNTSSADAGMTIQQVQNAFKEDPEDLRAAMAADLEASGGTSSGTLDRIRQIEQAVSAAVTPDIVVNADAPKEIKAIQDVQMTGAALNAAASEGDPSEISSVTLVIDKADTGIVIEEQQHNAVQFSMKLTGAVDRDAEKSGQQLIVPIIINMPVPENINPDFLVVLHKLSSGVIEQIRPSIYYDEAERRSHAVFVVSSFSDFALVEYRFCFDTDSVTKDTDSAAFQMEATGNASDSNVTYASSDPRVAEVDPLTGWVTIHKVGSTTITATAASTDVFPRAQTSYELTVKSAQAQHTASISAAVIPDSKEEAAFSDVPGNAYYREAVRWAAENGITKGTGNGTIFSPEKVCTRAEMVSFLWRAAGSPEPEDAGSFPDIPENAYYAKAVAWAMENGIAKGTGNGSTFSPDEPCTRAQAVTFLCRLAGGKAGSSTLYFTDVAQNAYYAKSVIWAVENGITKGTGNGSTFSPDEPCTRAQMVAFLYRYYAG